MNRLKDYTILFVPGFLTGIYDAVSVTANAMSTDTLIEVARRLPMVGGELSSLIPSLKLPVDEGTGVSFFDQQKAFSARGIDCVNMGEHGLFSTQNGIAKNGAAILDMLGKIGDRRVLIVSHSKGGLDTLEALIRADNPLRAKVHGWLSFQAPFSGTPFVDMVPAPLSEALMNVLGDGLALDDIKVSVRGSYMTENECAITSLTQRIPVTSAYGVYQANPNNQVSPDIFKLVSEAINPALLQDIVAVVMKNAQKYWYWAQTALAHNVSDTISLFSDRLNQTFKEVFGQFGLKDTFNLLIDEPNDGLVPAASAVLAGAEMVELSPRTDHAGPVMDTSPFHNFWNAKQRINNLEALLNALIERVPAS
jgi:hypothetical protein